MKLHSDCSREDGCLVLHKNGLNKPQRESARCTSWTSALQSSAQCKTFCWWLNGVMQVVRLKVTLGHLPLLDVLPQITFSLQEEMATTGSGGFHTSHEPPTEWWFWEDKGIVFALMDFKIVVNAQTDMISISSGVSLFLPVGSGNSPPKCYLHHVLFSILLFLFKVDLLSALVCLGDTTRGHGKINKNLIQISRHLSLCFQLQQ